MRIDLLYTEPAVIDPIRFHPGVNIIVGESDNTSVKNNGVGKSLCIEFLNFALLKRKSESRVARIPPQSFNDETLICVDIEIADISYTIKRSLADATHPQIFTNGRPVEFLKLEDAARFLGEKMFPRHLRTGVGFREMLGPLIRDERSEFKSLVACFDTKLKIPDNYAPHLMLLGIDPDIYRKIRELLREIDGIGKEERRIRENVQLIRQKPIDDARSDLNALDDEVERIGEAIDALENAPAYDLIKDQLLSLEDEIAVLRLRKDALARRLSGLKPIAVETDVDEDEIRSFYNQLREGLGDCVSRELAEVLSFQEKIAQFQRHLLGEKSEVVEAELKNLNKQLGDLDRQYAKLAGVLNQEGELSSLRQTYAAFQAKTDELGQLKGLLERYDLLALNKRDLKFEKDAELHRLQGNITGASERVKSFERTILGVHDFIQGNRKASFEVRTTTSKGVVEIVMRIDDDGSHSVEREKVFIYDIAMLMNDFTKARHPGLLVHDNIFDVDEDTFKRSLEFLFTKVAFEHDQQYILTLNADRLTHLSEEPWYTDFDESVVATFTKSCRFLKTTYQELQ